MSMITLFILSEQDKINVFINTFKNIKQISKYIHFRINDECLCIQGLSEDNHNIYEIKLTNNWFNYYGYNSEQIKISSFSLCSRQLKHILECYTNNHIIQFNIMYESEENKIPSIQIDFNVSDNIRCFGVNKSFSLYTYDNDIEIYDIQLQSPEISFIISCEFKNIIKEMLNYGENIIFECYREYIKFIVDDIEHIRHIQYSIPMQFIDNYQSQFQDNFQEKITMTYNLETLHTGLLFNSICNYIQINIKKDFPLHIQYLFDLSDVNMVDANIIHTFISPIMNDNDI